MPFTRERSERATSHGRQRATFALFLAVLAMMAELLLTAMPFNIERAAAAERIGAERTDQTAAGLVGRQIADFTLRDFRGKTHQLSDYSDRPWLVVAFLGTECPLAKLYAPRLEALSGEFGPRGVAFLGIDSNRQDSVTKMAAFARLHQIEFPLLKDPGNVVADVFGALRTPEVFVLDAERRVVYHGRVDDQFSFSSGVGYARNEAQNEDLRTALDELLAGRPVSQPQTEVKGCLIGRVKEPRADSEVTYSNQIARIFADRCVNCHRPGEIAPFPLLSYEDAAGWGDMIREVVHEQRMPPWHANPQYGHFLNDARLTAEELRLIDAWVDAGCPEGDPADLPPVPTFAEGWGIGTPDYVGTMSHPFRVPAQGVVDYQNFVVDPGFTEDKWITAAEARPGNRSVVHHIIVFVRRPGERGGFRGEAGGGFLVATAPGAKPVQYQPGYAKRVPAGSRLVFQMHYTPNGSEQFDQSSVGLVFADPETVTHEVQTSAAANMLFAIPPHDDNYLVRASRSFRRDTLLISLFPHAHLRGKSFRYVAEYPDGSSEILLDVPRYDFNWQNTYELAEPKLLPKGTRLRVAAYYDNSEHNLANPDPNRTVTFGQQTWDEMMIGFFDATLADGIDAEAATATSPATADPPRREGRPRERSASRRPLGGE